jgi:ribose transport system substrate-binding protein
MPKNRVIFASMLCCLPLGIALSGCGGASQGASGASADQPLIGLSMRFIAGNSWLSTLSSGAVEAGKAKGYDVEAVDAQGNASQQLQQMQTFINKGAKAIIIEPVGDRSVAAGIAAAKRANVPVIVVNDQVAPELATEVACNVHDDGSATAEQVGAETAAVAAQRFADKKSIKLYIQAIFAQELVTESRENGFMKGWNGYFAANPGPTTDRIPNNYGEALPDKTLTAMRNVVSGNPDVNVIFNQTDVVMPAVMEALKGANLADQDGKTDIVIAGFDGGTNVIKAMAEDQAYPVVADGLNQPATQAAHAVDEAIAAATGKPTGQCPGNPPTRLLPAVVATPENASTFVSDLAFAGSK